MFLERQIIEEIDAMQQKLNERTDKLNAMKNRHNELTRTLDETETHLKQASREILYVAVPSVLGEISRETTQWTLPGIFFDWLLSSHKIEQLEFNVTVFFSIKFDHVSHKLSFNIYIKYFV